MFIFIFLLPVDKILFAETNGLSVRDSVKMVTIGAGEFLMGSKPNEGRSEEHTSELPVTSRSRMPSSA